MATEYKDIKEKAMSQILIDFLQQHNLPREVIIFIISLFPIVELRGGLIAAALFKVPMMQAFLTCFVANIIPIPFILLFIKVIFKFLKKFRMFQPMVNWLENKAMSKSESVKNKQLIGLYCFVAIPLPGTGGWTGALIASLLDMPFQKSFLTIAAGVFSAGIIMLMITYFIPGLFGF